MRKKLSAIGNSLGLVIEKPILELLDIDRDTELDMRTDGDRLIISPVRKGKKERVRTAHQRAVVAHDETLRRLARRGNPREAHPKARWTEAGVPPRSLRRPG